MASVHFEAPTSPTSVISPTSAMPLSPRSQLDAFLETGEDVLEWTHDWEQRSSNMDKKHIEVMCSQWKLMRESAKEHSQIIHHMKKALYEMRANGMTLQDRLDALENKLRDDMGKETATRVDDLDKRFRERIRQEEDTREAEIAELRELIKSTPDKVEGRLAAMERFLGERLQQEKDARISEAAELREYLRREPDRLDARFGDLEDRLSGRISREQDVREADVAELRHLFHGESAKLEALCGDIERLVSRGKDHRESLEQLIAQERAAREASVQAVRSMVNDERLDREARLDVVQGLLEKEGEVLRGVKQFLLEESSGRARSEAAMQARMDAVERLLEEAKDQQARAAAALRDDLAADARRREESRRENEDARRKQDARALEDRFAAIQSKLDEALRGVNMEEILELVANERLNRQTDLAGLQQAVEQEFNEHHARAEANKASLAGSCSALEHGLDALRRSVQDSLERQEQSVQSRVEHVLRILQESSTSMVQSWRNADSAAGWAES